MTSGIAIVGAGISGLHLALRLHQLGVDATLYTAQGPEDLRGGRPPNLVTRLASTREREQVLGLDDWADSRFDNPWMHMRIEVDGGPAFRGRLPSPASSVDFRLYLSDLLAQLENRGAKVVRHTPADRAELAAIAQRHELTIVAAGRGALRDVFPRDPARSPFATAPRALLGGLFHGVRPPEPAGMSMSMVPGAGEVHAPTYHSFGGQCTAVLVEAVPGGPFDAVVRADFGDDTDLLAKQVLNLITTHTPSLRERIDEREFALTRPIDFLQGALVPTVRHNVAEVADGRYAVAIGDAWIVNDPLTAQGANLGSQQAFQVAQALSAHTGGYGEGFCHALADVLWHQAQPVVDWTNAFIGEPSPHVLKLLTAASADQRVADAFVANLDRPDAMWHTISAPDHTDEFVTRVRSVA